MIAMIRRSPKKRGRERGGKYFARRISPAQKLRRPIVTLRPCFVHGLVKTEPEFRAILMGAVQIRIAGAFMPAGPPKAIGGTYESIFGPILIVLQHETSVSGRYGYPISALKSMTYAGKRRLNANSG